jgi:hypothetical protein
MQALLQDTDEHNDATLNQVSLLQQELSTHKEEISYLENKLKEAQEQNL